MTDGPLLTKSMQRCLANDPRQRASVMKDVEGVFNPHIPFSKKPNARWSCHLSCHHDGGCSTWRLNIRIYCGHTEMEDSLIHACQRPPRGPVRGWISNICLRVDPYGMAKSLEKVMSANLERLQSLGLLSRKTNRHCHRHASDTTLGSQARGRTGALKEQGQDGQF